MFEIGEKVIIKTDYGYMQEYNTDPEHTPKECKFFGGMVFVVKDIIYSNKGNLFMDHFYVLKNQDHDKLLINVTEDVLKKFEENQ